MDSGGCSDQEDQARAKPVGGLLVEHDHAELRYDGGIYRATMRRKLVNNGEHPIARYLIRVSVDRFPGDPQRSNQLYRDNPLTWEEIGLQAWCGEYRAEPMRWTVQHDRDAFKEVWLLFANDSGRFPLYPGDSTWIEYTYTGNVRDVEFTAVSPWRRRAGGGGPESADRSSLSGQRLQEHPRLPSGEAAARPVTLRHLVVQGMTCEE